MAGLATDGRHKTGKHAALELQHVGGRQVLRHQHQGRIGQPLQHGLRAVLRRSGRRWRRCHGAGGQATHLPQDAVGHLLQVGLALAQVGVLHLVELARDLLQLRHQRPFGVVQALGHPVAHARRQHLVLQQHQVHFQQGGQLARRILGQVADQALQLVDHGRAGLAGAVQLRLDLVRVDEVVPHLNPAGGHHHRPPNRNAARNGQPMDGKCHALILFNDASCWAPTVHHAKNAA